MGKASITIAVSSVFNGAGFEKAISSAEKLGSRVSRIEKLTAANVNSMSSDVAKLGMRWEEAGRKMAESGRRIAAVGDSLTRSVTVPMVAAGVYAGKMAVDFDSALANVRKTSDLTESQLESLAASALEFSKVQPVTAETILNVEALGAQLGIAQGNLENFARVATGLDIATNMNAEQAGTELARFANIVGMAEDEYENYGSTLVAIGNNMATTESEVSQMAQRFASAGKQAGLTEAEILGLSGAMSALGIKSEMGGSALSQVFVSISKSVANGGDQLEAFAKRAGMSAEEFSAAWRDNAADAFTQLLKGINDASEAGTDMNVVLAEMGFTQIRQSDIMRRMAGSIDEVTGALDLSRDAWRQNSALQAEVDQRNESMASRLQVLKNKVDAVAVTLGGPLVEAVISAVDALAPAVEAVAGAAQAFADMDESGQRSVLMWAGVVAASGPALSVFGRMKQAVGGVIGILGSATSKVAVYSDAMNSLNGANLRTYGSSKSSASALGLAANAAVKAAGGVDNYVSAWDAMIVSADRVKKAEIGIREIMREVGGSLEDATAAQLKRASALETELNLAEHAYKSNAKLVSAWGGTTAEAEKAAHGIKGLDGALKEVKDGAKSGGVAVEALGRSVGRADAPSKKLGSTLKSSLSGGAKFAAASLKQLAVSMAPMAAVTAVVAGIGLVASKLEDMRVHAELVATANRSFAENMALAGEKASESSAGIEVMTLSLSELEDGSRKALESTAGLANGIVESMAGAMAGQAALERYTATIESIGLNTELTASQQARLKAAVEGYNKVAGTQYEVVDAANGVIADQNGKVLENTELLRRNTEEWGANARTQALQNQQVKAYETLYEQQQQAAKAQETYNQQIENYIATVPGATRAMAEAALENSSYKRSLDDATLAVEGTKTQIEGLDSALTVASSTLSGTFKDAVMQMPAYAQQAGIDMASKLAEGVEAGRITAQQAATFLTDDVATVLAQLPPEMQQTGLDSALGLATSIATGSVSVGSAAGQLRSMAKSAVDPLPGEMSSTGSSASSGLAGGLSSNSGAVGSAASGLSSSARGGVADLTKSLNSTGYTASTGLAGGLSKGQGKVGSSSKSLASEAKKMADVGDMNASGSHLASNFASGLSSGIKKVGDAAAKLAEAAKAKLGFSVPEEGPWAGAERGGETSGRHLAENWARGMRSGMPDIRAAAGDLALAAAPPVPLSSAAAPLSATSGGGDSYTVVINGSQSGGMSPAVRDAVRVIVDEYRDTMRMGVAL